MSTFSAQSLRISQELLEEFYQRESAWLEQRMLFQEQLEAGQEDSFKQLQYSFEQLRGSFERLQQSYHQIKEAAPLSQTPFREYLKDFQGLRLPLRPSLGVREQLL